MVLSKSVRDPTKKRPKKTIHRSKLSYRVQQMRNILSALTHDEDEALRRIHGRKFPSLAKSLVQVTTTDWPPMAPCCTYSAGTEVALVTCALEAVTS